MDAVETDVPVDEVIEQPAEEVVDQAVETSPWEGFVPSKTGMDSRYDTMNPDQFAREFKHHNETYGKQSQELGELRRQSKVYQEKIKRFMEAADKPIQEPAQVEGLDDFTKQQFYDMMEKGNPQKAIDLLIGDRFNPKYDGDDFKSAVQSIMQDNFNQYHAYQSEEQIRSDPDYPQYSGYIDTLRTDEHFGSSRRPEELLSFAKLVQENKPLADVVYSNMRRYPAMSVDDAKKFANLSMNHSATEQGKRDDYKKTVDKLDSVAPASAAAKASQNDKISSMEDAFNL